VVPFVGSVPLEVVKPTWANEPEVGTMNIEYVVLKVTELELAAIVHGVVADVESVEKVMFVDVPPQVGANRPIYANPWKQSAWCE